MAKAGLNAQEIKIIWADIYQYLDASEKQNFLESDMPDNHIWYLAEKMNLLIEALG